MTARKKRKTELWLLIALRFLIHANMNKTSTGAILCSDASSTGGATLYCPFARFHEIQRRLVLDAHNALQFDVNVLEVKWKLISK